MNRFAKCLLSLSLTGATLGASAATAHADNDFQAGYVCIVRSSWNTAENNGYNVGPDGSTEIDLYSGPACTGSYVGTSYIMTVGQTACPSNTSATPAGMQATVALLAQARTYGLPVEVDIWPGLGIWAGASCAAQLSLVAPPAAPTTAAASAAPVPSAH